MNTFWLGTMIDNACILMIAALGDAVCLTAGEYNLGGDGQIYAAAFACAITITSCGGLLPPIALMAGLAAAIFASVILSLLSVVLKVCRGVNVLLSTYIASCAVTPIIDSLIAFRFRAEGNLLATSLISGDVSPPRIMMPSNLTSLSLAAPILCILVAVYLQKSETGKKLFITGVSNEVALYAGIKVSSLSSYALIFAAMMHGAAGFIMAAGTYRCCVQGFQNGIGWSALTAALMARHSTSSRENKLSAAFYADSIIFSSLLLSALITGASMLTLTHFVLFDASALIQGTAIALIAMAPSRSKR